MIALLTPLLALFGGTAFRLFIGNAMDWFKQATDHKQELEKMRLQMEIDNNEHKLNMEAQTLQSQLGIKTIEAQSVAASALVDSSGFLETIKGINATSAMVFATGKWWIDMIPNLIAAFNQVIRPTMAAVAIWLWILAVYKAGWIMSDWDKELAAGIFGVFIGDRIHAKRNE